MTRSSLISRMLALGAIIGPIVAASPALAASLDTGGDLTASGLSVVPYVHGHPGDVTLSLKGGYVDVPGALGYGGGDVGLRVGLPRGLQILAQGGTQTSAGLRGRLWSFPWLDLGWDARYRVDSYAEQWLAGQGAYGLTTPPAVIGSGSLLPGRFAQGLQVAIESAWSVGATRIYLAPEALAMSNRDALGATLGLDQVVGPLAIGLGIEAQDNLANPDRAVRLNPLQLRYGAGLSYDAGPVALSASYRYVPADSYGYPSHTVLVGAGIKLHSAGSAPVASASVAFSRDSVIVADCLTVGGLDIAPRYLGQVGDVDETLLGVAGQTASALSFTQGQINQVRLPAHLVALSAWGPRSFFGLRGPLGAPGAFRLGWDARLRSDPGTIADTGDANLGGELALDGEFRFMGLEAYLAPQALALTDRLAAGAALGVDFQLGQVAVGLGAQAERNFLSPDRVASLNPLQTNYSVGARYYLNPWAYLQMSFHDIPADTFGRPERIVEAGLGSRVLGDFSR